MSRYSPSVQPYAPAEDALEALAGPIAGGVTAALQRRVQLHIQQDAENRALAREKDLIGYRAQTESGIEQQQHARNRGEQLGDIQSARDYEQQQFDRSEALQGVEKSHGLSTLVHPEGSYYYDPSKDITLGRRGAETTEQYTNPAFLAHEKSVQDFQLRLRSIGAGVTRQKYEQSQTEKEALGYATLWAEHKVPAGQIVQFLSSMFKGRLAPGIISGLATAGYRANLGVAKADVGSDLAAQQREWDILAQESINNGEDAEELLGPRPGSAPSGVRIRH